jgi:hypothetical protein
MGLATLALNALSTRWAAGSTSVSERLCFTPEMEDIVLLGEWTSRVFITMIGATFVSECV